jgi:hypothetical protein
MRASQTVVIATVVATGIAVAALQDFAHGQQEYPTKPIRLIVGFPAGSQMDIVARLFGQKLAEAWAKPVVIDNVSGTAGSIAADRVAKGTADGGAGSARLGAWMRPGLGLSKSGAGRGTRGCGHNSWPGLLRLLPQTGLRRTSRSRPGSDP